MITRIVGKGFDSQEEIDKLLKVIESEGTAEPNKSYQIQKM